MAGEDGRELRELADRVRLRSLDEVAPLPGYVRDPADRSRWRRDGSVPGVTGVRYFDHLQGRGGGSGRSAADGVRAAGAVRPGLAGGSGLASGGARSRGVPG